jgi:hypothetical protein
MFLQRVTLLILSFLAIPSVTYAEVDNTQLAVWANEAMVATYTYNYKNYLARQKEIALYFTSNGWIAYSKALNDSKIPDAVQKNSYFVSAVATMPPKIKVLRSNYFQATMPLLVVYSNPQYQQKQNVDITLEFTAAASGQGVRGFAVESLQAKQATPPCKCCKDREETKKNPETPGSPSDSTK